MALPKAVAEAAKDKPVRVARGWRHRYGVVLTQPLTNWQLELFCWRQRYDSGLGAFHHLRRACEILFPESVWHEWREMRFRALCDDEYAHRLGDSVIRNHSWVGCGAATKTYDAGLFAFLYFLADPLRTSVCLTSTSKGKMRQRVWPIIQDLYLSAKAVMEQDGTDAFKMVNSMMELQATPGDHKCSIFGQAVDSGEVAKAVERLKGVHLPRMLLVIDEAPGTPDAIYSNIPNQLKGGGEYILLNTGNGPSTHLDCFSRVCTPVSGWKSISVDSEMWITKAIPEFQLPRGVCLHFDGTKSPNVKAGKTIFPFLYTYENWLRIKDNAEAQRTAEFWKQDRGFWIPEGFVKTVLSEELIEQGNARGEIQFAGTTTPIGSLDSGFGGDNCTLRTGRMGKMANGKLAVQIDQRIIIPILVDLEDEKGKKVPAEYQISKKVMEICIPLGIKPEYFGIEASGTGRGAAAVLTQEWGEVIWVESGGKPSDIQASEEDERPSHEIYDRKITELYFSVQAFVRGSQLGGLIDDDVIQFCSRTYEMPNRKYVLEKKEDLKARLGRSCDDSDSVVVMVHVARIHGMQTVGPRQERMQSMFDTEIEANNALFLEENLYQPEEIGG